MLTLTQEDKKRFAALMQRFGNLPQDALKNLFKEETRRMAKLRCFADSVFYEFARFLGFAPKATPSQRNRARSLYRLGLLRQFALAHLLLSRGSSDEWEDLRSRLPSQLALEASYEK